MKLSPIGQWILRLYMREVLSRPINRSINWTSAERSAFDLFCKSACGIKLFEFLRQIVATQTFNSVYAPDVSKMAEARGAQNFLALLHRLRVFPSAESSQVLEEVEQTGLPGRNADSSDDWRWLGGSGAIG